MLYASDFRALEELTNGAIEQNPEDIPDLIAEFLIRSVKKRFKQPLTQGYYQQHNKMNRVRGKIDVLTTETKQLLKRGQVACIFEELTLNTPRNCYIRAALQLLSRMKNTKQELRMQCKYWSNEMIRQGITDSKPDERKISAERFSRHDLHDKPMLDAAKLAFQLALPTEELGDHAFLTPNREEQWVYKLFEKAVAGFYRINLPKTWCVVPGKRLGWQITQRSAGIDAVLPNMQTDIFLENVTQKSRITIDTKFTSILKKGQYKEKTISSGYLYQIYAYLFSQKGLDDFEGVSQGVLLHPSVGEVFDETVVIQEYPIRFMTIDLAGSPADWKHGLFTVTNLEHY